MITGLKKLLEGKLIWKRQEDFTWGTFNKELSRMFINRDLGGTLGTLATVRGTNLHCRGKKQSQSLLHSASSESKAFHLGEKLGGT